MVEALVAVALRAILASVVLGAVLTALVLAATRYLALNAATRHALWTTALIATAVMPLAGVGMSVYRSAAVAPVSAAETTSRTTTVSSHAKPVDATVSHRTAGHLATVTAPRAAHGTGAAAAPSPAASPSIAEIIAEKLAFVRATPRMSRTIALGLAVAWLVGALAGLIGLAASVIRVRGLKRRSSPLDGTLADELPWLTEIGHGREIYLRLSFETETPVAIGFSRPVILIPTELATAEGLAAIEQLVLHEYAHLRRYDDWTNLVQRVIERVFWFNPIVWFVGRRIALEREIASDDAVVEKTGEAHAYATSLWRLAREMRMPEHAAVAPGALLTRKQITVRIEQLLDKRRARLHRSPAAALGVLLAGFAAVGFVATSAPAVELPATPEQASSTVAYRVVVPSWHRASAQPPAHRPARTLERTELVAVTQVKSHADPNVAPLEQKTVRFELVPMPTVAPAKRVKTIAAQRIVEVQTTTQEPPMAPMPPATSARPERPVTAPEAAMPAPLAPPGAPSVTFKIGAGTTLTPQQIEKLQVVASSALAQAMRQQHDGTSVTPEVSKALRNVIATLPREVAQESSWNRRTRFDGVKLSRELIASCIGCSFRNADVRGVDLHGLKLNGIDFAGADMRGVNLSGAQLIGVSLAHANLSNADLRNAEINGSELRGATLDGAQLDGVKLIGITIRGVSLRGTVLRSVVNNCNGCDLSYINLNGQDLHGILLNGSDLHGAQFVGTNLNGAQLVGVSLNGANLSRADLRNAQVNGAELRDANFERAQLEGIKLNGVSIRTVNLRGTSLRSVIASCMGCDFGRLDLHGQDLHGITLNGANLAHADLHGANLSGVHFTGVDLSYANLNGADLTNAHFDGCNLTGVEFRGAKTTGMTMYGSGTDG